ncbi:BTAD domain-containing putative transcriptional regulator [Streptomyces sp. NPDC054932]
MEARREGQRIPLGGVKSHTVLVALLLARGRVVPDARLGSLLWGWDPPATAHAQIYTYVSRLRKALGEGVRLVRQAPGYVLHCADSWIDLVEFERLDRSGSRALAEHRYEDADRELRSALALWRGPALGDVAPHLAEIEADRLEEARAATLERRIAVDFGLGRHRELIAELTGLVAQFPIRERLRGQLMSALHRSGRQADALHVYHHGRKVLAEIGVDPGRELTDIYYQVLREEPAGPAVPALPVLPAQRSASSGALPPAPPAHPVPPASLPLGPPDFTGRERELGELLAKLVPLRDGGRTGCPPRRLLLTGMAGVGKTALALHAARTRLKEFPDGQLYADLCHPDGSRKDPCRILVSLLLALGEPAATVDRRSADLDELMRLFRARTRGRRLLILLDNAVGDLQLDPLLPSCPEPVVLITGRARLASVPHSHTVEVLPMAADGAAELLRAIAGPERFAAEPAAARELLRLCGGLPMALRAAGSRLAARPLWPVARLVDRLADPSTRLQELRFGDLALPPLLAQSLGRLRPGGPAFLHTLVALGPLPFSAFTASAQLGLSPLVAERFLEDLVDHALLEMEGIDRAGEPRYRFHELVLCYAASLAPAVTRPTVPPSPQRSSEDR